MKKQVISESEIAAELDKLTPKKGAINMRFVKKIINGKLYDTTTATLISEVSYGQGKRDFRYYCEELYRTKKGTFFLYGEGGGLSPYASIDGDGRGWGEAIRPLTDDEAKKWMEQNAPADTYIAIFGPPEEA